MGFLILSANSATAAIKTSTSSASATDSAQLESRATAQLAEDAKLKLRERIQKILGDQDEVTNNKDKKGGYIGEVTRLSDESITLKTLDGSEIIPIQDTTILLKRTKKIPITDLVVGNWLIVIGNREKNRSINPELLLVQTTDLKPREHIVTIGAVDSISTREVSVIPRGKTDPLKLTLTKNSELIDSAGELMTVKGMPEDISAVIVGYATTNGWELGTLKATISMSEYKSAPTPTPKPTYAPRKATPKPTVSPTPSTTN